MSRRESVAILDMLARMATLNLRDPPPYKLDGDLLIIPPAAILDYLKIRGHSFAITSTRRLIDHLARDGFLVARGSRSINGVKFGSCVSLSLRAMADAGIDWPITE